MIFLSAFAASTKTAQKSEALWKWNNLAFNFTFFNSEFSIGKNWQICLKKTQNWHSLFYKMEKTEDNIQLQSFDEFLKKMLTNNQEQLLNVLP